MRKNGYVGSAMRRRWIAVFMIVAMWLLVRGVRGKWMFARFADGGLRLW